jgi:Zn-dependent peptidase ImmA (M78 family)
MKKLVAGTYICGDYNANRVVEIGAEIFAAEFIYPEAEFVVDAHDQIGDSWTPELLVRFKRQCKAKVSYRFLCKRLEWLRAIKRGEFDGIKFQQLEYSLFGIPSYRRWA